MVVLQGSVHKSRCTYATWMELSHILEVPGSAYSFKIEKKLVQNILIFGLDADLCRHPFLVH
jgi:hypothetical protein